MSVFEPIAKMLAELFGDALFEWLTKYWVFRALIITGFLTVVVYILWHLRHS